MKLSIGKGAKPDPRDHTIRLVPVGIRRLCQPDRDTVAVRDGNHAIGALPQLLGIAVFLGRCGLLSADGHLGRDPRFGHAAHGIHHSRNPIHRLRHANRGDDPAHG